LRARGLSSGGWNKVAHLATSRPELFTQTLECATLADKARSDYNSHGIAALNDSTLKESAQRVAAMKQAADLTHSRLPTISQSAEDEMDAKFGHLFKNEDDRMIAKIVLQRVSRAAEKAYQTHVSLSRGVDAFISEVLTALRANEAQRLCEEEQACQRLQQSHAAHKHDVARLEAELAEALHGGLHARGRLGVLLSVTRKRAEAELSMHVDLLHASLTEAEMSSREDENRHDSAFAQLRKEHTRQIEELSAARRLDADIAHRALEQQRATRDAIEDSLRSRLAAEQSARAKLHGELDELAQTQALTARKLDATTRQASEEANRLATEMSRREAWLRRSAEQDHQRMTLEVQRLRDVQGAVLNKARALPGGEARRLLFYESTKSRKVLQPDSSMTWRGQHAKPSPHVLVHGARAVWEADGVAT